MARSPSRYSPEFEKPQKPENHSGCCQGACGKPTPTPDRVRVGCSLRYRGGCDANYIVGKKIITTQQCR